MQAAALAPLNNALDSVESEPGAMRASCVEEAHEHSPPSHAPKRNSSPSVQAPRSKPTCASCIMNKQRCSTIGAADEGTLCRRVVLLVWGLDYYLRSNQSYDSTLLLRRRTAATAGRHWQGLPGPQGVPGDTSFKAWITWHTSFKAWLLGAPDTSSKRGRAPGPGGHPNRLITRACVPSVLHLWKLALFVARWLRGRRETEALS